MARLIPFVVCFFVGLVVGIGVAFRKGSGSSTAASEWQEKYQDIYKRYRDLNQQLKNRDTAMERRLDECHRVLRNVGDLLKNSDSISAEQVQATYSEIKGVLEM